MKNFVSAATRAPAVLLLAAASGPAVADDVYCPPDIGAVTIDGNVLVAGACRLDGTVVKGNVLLYEGGSLVARGADIDGNVQAANANFVDIAATRVGGSIQLDDLVGDFSIVTGSTIDGSIQLVGNRSRMEIADNGVGADVQAFSNTGGLAIADNVIDGNLQCKSNVPAPTGGGNTVSGNKEDQCANLVPDSGSPPAGGTTAGAPAGGTADAPGDTTTGGAGGAGPLLLLLALLGPARRRRGRRAARSA